MNVLTIAAPSSVCMDYARARSCEKMLDRFHPRHRSRVKDLARRHNRLEDLALSFPALLFALAVPRQGFDSEPQIKQVIAGASLKALGRDARVPLWLRTLMPEAFVRPIVPLPDGVFFRRQIANHIPRSPNVAPNWLQAVSTAYDAGNESFAIWIAREFNKNRKSVRIHQLRLVALYAWYSHTPGNVSHNLIEKPWVPSMNFATALGHTEKWLTESSLYAHLGNSQFDDMWFEPETVDGFEFEALRSKEEICNEAIAMDNCLRSYGSSIARNAVRFWSVRKGNERVATLQLGFRVRDPFPSVVHIHGPKNQKVNEDVWRAARSWMHAQPLCARTFKKWSEDCTDRDAWLELWRPYWIARRRLPSWLPLTPPPHVFSDWGESFYNP